MSENSKPRPVTGEILGSRTAESETARAGGAFPEQVVDAEFETIAAEPAFRGQGFQRSRAAASTGLDMLRPQGREEASRRGGPVFWSFGLVFVAGAFWVSGGHALVDSRLLIDVARPSPAVRIASLTSRVDTSGEKPLLVVDGEAVNDGDSVHAVPTLSIRVRDKDGRTKQYFLGTNDRLLDPGGHFAFSSRLPAPKHGVESVSVTLGEAQD